MAVRQVLIQGSSDEVWSVLSDGYAYAEWVVGTTSVREVDETWPQVGSSIHYTVGRGPLRLEDRTIVRVLQPGRHIELEAFAPPLGSARTVVEVIPWGEASVVILDEHPLRGPGARLHSGLVEFFLHLRNRRMLTNLARVVEARHRRHGPGMGWPSGVD